MTALPDVTAVLPHRAPFLFIDEAVELSERRVVGQRRFRDDEPYLAGHFPGRPVVPGVLLLEGMAQTMAYWAISRGASPSLFLVGIDRARFRQPVLPGTQVRFEVDVGEDRFGLVKAKARAVCGDACVVEAELTGYHSDGNSPFR